MNRKRNKRKQKNRKIKIRVILPFNLIRKPDYKYVDVPGGIGYFRGFR